SEWFRGCSPPGPPRRPGDWRDGIAALTSVVARPRGRPAARPRPPQAPLALDVLALHRARRGRSNLLAAPERARLLAGRDRLVLRDAGDWLAAGPADRWADRRPLVRGGALPQRLLV